MFPDWPPCNTMRLPSSSTTEVTRAPGRELPTERQTAFSSQPMIPARTRWFDLFRRVNRNIVAGKAESLALTGMKGEKASISTVTGTESSA